MAASAAPSLAADVAQGVAIESASAQTLRDDVANLKTRRGELSQRNISLLRANDDSKNANEKLLHANDALKENVSAQQKELDAQQARSDDLNRSVALLDHILIVRTDRLAVQVRGPVQVDGQRAGSV